MLKTGRVWLLDCGEGNGLHKTKSSSVIVVMNERPSAPLPGTQQQLEHEASQVKASRIDVILITHLHGDHVLGVFGLLMSLGLKTGGRHTHAIGLSSFCSLLFTTY